MSSIARGSFHLGTALNIAILLSAGYSRMPLFIAAAVTLIVAASLHAVSQMVRGGQPHEPAEPERPFDPPSSTAYLAVSCMHCGHDIEDHGWKRVFKELDTERAVRVPPDEIPHSVTDFSARHDIVCFVFEDGRPCPCSGHYQIGRAC